MDDVRAIPDFKIKLEKGEYNEICRTDPDLGIGWAVLCRVVCGCEACKAQLKTLWLPRVDRRKQPRYAENKECQLWASYEGANNWHISQLVAQTLEDEMGA